MRHLVYPTQQMEEDVWVASCSCGFRELHSTRDDALRAAAKHDMSDVVWRDRLKKIEAYCEWASKPHVYGESDDGGTASEPGDDYRTTRQADDA